MIKKDGHNILDPKTPFKIYIIFFLLLDSFPPPAAAPDELDEPEDVKEQAEGKMALSASQKVLSSSS